MIEKVVEEEEVEEDAGDSSLERLRELAGVKFSLCSARA